MTQRVIKGALYAPKKGCLFGLFLPNPRFNIFEFGEFNDRATRCSSSRLGKISTNIEKTADGDGQGIVIFTDSTKVKRRDFERLIKDLFPDCRLDIDKWITRVSRRDDRLFWASITVNRMRQR